MRESKSKWWWWDGKKQRFINPSRKKKKEEKSVKVKCKKCGTEWGIPDIGIPVEMDDCPYCQKIEKTLKGIISETGTQT